MDFPPTKIPERYTGLQSSVGLELVCNLSAVKLRVFALISFNDGLHFNGKDSRACGDANNEFFVLIDDVEVVDDEKGIVRRIGGIIRLNLFDETQNIRVCDSLYFSFKSLSAAFISGPLIENGKLDMPRSCGREVPHDVIKTGSQMVDDFTGEHAKTWWNRKTLMVRHSLQKQLSVVLWQNGVIAFLKEEGDFPIEITDVLFGPY